MSIFAPKNGLETEISLRFMWLWSRDLRGTRALPSADLSHELSWLQDDSKHRRRRYHRRYRPLLPKRGRASVPQLRQRQYPRLGQTHLPQMPRRDATHRRKRVLDVNSKYTTCVIYTLMAWRTLFTTYSNHLPLTLSQITSLVATTPTRIWIISWNQPQIPVPLQQLSYFHTLFVHFCINLVF